MHPAIEKNVANKPRSCQVAGCGCSLEDAGRYCQKRKICRGCSQASAVQQEDGQLYRFCQQHGRLEPLASFSGVKRSCRSALKQRRAAAATAGAAPASTKSSNSSNTAQPPLGLSSNSGCSSLVGSDLQLMGGDQPATNVCTWSSMAAPAAIQRDGSAREQQEADLGTGGIHSAAAAEDAELEQLIEQALLEAAAAAAASDSGSPHSSMMCAFSPSAATTAAVAALPGFPMAAARPGPGQPNHEARVQLLQQQYQQLQGALADLRHMLQMMDPLLQAPAVTHIPGPSPAALVSWTLAACQASEWHGFGGSMSHH